MKVLLAVVLHGLTILSGTGVWLYFNFSALLKPSVESNGSEVIDPRPRQA